MHLWLHVVSRLNPSCLPCRPTPPALQRRLRRPCAGRRGVFRGAPRLLAAAAAVAEGRRRRCCSGGIFRACRGIRAALPLLPAAARLARLLCLAPRPAAPQEPPTEAVRCRQAMHPCCPHCTSWVFYPPCRLPQEPPTEAFRQATQHYMQHRFEPQLQARRRARAAAGPRRCGRCRWARAAAGDAELQGGPVRHLCRPLSFDCPIIRPITQQTNMQAAGVKYEVDIIVEETDESVGGVGEAICAKADELQAAAVRGAAGRGARHFEGRCTRQCVGGARSQGWGAWHHARCCTCGRSSSRRGRRLGRALDAAAGLRAPPGRWCWEAT